MANASKPPGKIYQPITNIDSLKEGLQWALSGELSAIPPYLCALYSIRDPTSDEYVTIRSVVVEEMLHMMQVANLMNAIGGCPSLSADYVPRYPGFLLHHAVGGPFVQLQAYSPTLARAVFMPIEQPDTSRKPPVAGAEFETVGQFYWAIKEGFINCVKSAGEDRVFPKGRPQIMDTYFGPGGGELIRVTNLISAKRAINEITEQGEGALSPSLPTPGSEPFGGYQHYGTRADGTYGPIVGRPWEMSHYRKFQQLAEANSPVAIYPMQTNPSADVFSGLTKDLAKLFNAVYASMLRNLEALFKTGKGDWFFGAAFPLMRYALAPLAILLMQTPLKGEADPSTGPNAGPPFAYDAMPDEEILKLAQDLSGASPGFNGGYAQLWQGTLNQVSQTIKASLDAMQAWQKVDEKGGPRALRNPSRDRNRPCRQ